MLLIDLIDPSRLIIFLYFTSLSRCIVLYFSSLSRYIVLIQMCSAANAAMIFGVYLVLDSAASTLGKLRHDQHEGAKAKAELAKIKKNAKAAGVSIH